MSTINFQLGPQAAGSFSDELYNFLLVMETVTGDASDALELTTVKGNPTIGVGFDLIAGKAPVVNAILPYMGFQSDVISMSGAPSDKIKNGATLKEYNYLHSLRAAIQSKSVVAINAVMAARAADSDQNYRSFYPNRPSSFSFANEDQMKSAFLTLWPSVYRSMVLSTYPTLKDNAQFLSSREMLVLADLTWNGGTGLIEGTLRTDILSGNRADAWYQLRYNSNKSADKGLAKRRYFESQIFGLYDSIAGAGSMAEALQDYQVLTKNRKKIFDDEGNFGYLPDGTKGSKLENNAAKRVAIDAAVEDYADLFDSPTNLPSPQKLTDIYSTAKSKIISGLQDIYSGQQKLLGVLSAAADNINDTNIYVTSGAGTEIDVANYRGTVKTGGSLLYDQYGGCTITGGASGHDVLIAHAGGDTLVANGAGDTLIGGVGRTVMKGFTGGQNTFLYSNPAAGEVDEIQASNGEIYIGANKLAGPGGGALATGDGAGNVTWTASDGTQYAFTANELSYVTGEGKLTISHGALLGEAGGQIIIDKFNLSSAQSGSAPFGLNFGKEQVKVTKGSKGYSIGDVIGLAESPTDPLPGAILYTVYVSEVKDEGQIVDISLQNGDGSAFAVDNGKSITSLGSGSVEVTVASGQDRASFWLINTKDVLEPEAVNLTATLKSDNETSTLEVDYEASPSASSQGSDQKTIVNGGLVEKPSDFSPILFVLNDEVMHGPDGDNGFYAYVSGDHGDISASQKSYVKDSSGKSVVAANGYSDVILLDGGGNEVYADQKVDLTQAISSAKSGHADGQKGDLISVGDGNNTIVGGTGDSFINVGQGDNVIVMGSGNSTLWGGVLPINGAIYDWSVPSNGDAVSGIAFPEATGTKPDSKYQGNKYGNPTNGYYKYGGGNDTIYGGSGKQVIWLSNGDNYVDLGSGNSTVQGGMGSDTIFGGTGNVLVRGGGGDSYIEGEGGNDTLVGQAGNNTIYGGNGNDTISAGDDGDDWATAQTGSNYVEAGNGNDSIFGSGGNDTLIGGTGNDTISAGAGNEYIYAGESGQNLIQGGSGNDTLIGSDDGQDTIIAASGSTTIYGGDGVEYLEGGSGDNLIYAGDGGTPGQETTVVAGSGSTTIYGGLGVDQIFGGSGSATIYAGDGGTEDDPTYVVAGSGATTIYGGAGFDYLAGGASSDGGDYIVGGSGDSTLAGGAGDDTLVAGTGDTTLISGEGQTTFQIGADAGDVMLQSSGGDAPILEFTDAVSASDFEIQADILSDGSIGLEIVGDSVVELEALPDQVVIGGVSMSLQEFFQATQTTSLTEDFEDGQLTFDANNGTALNAGTGQDTVLAWGNNDSIVAGSGNNKLAAFGQNSVVTGGAGNDTLIAGGSNSTLVGGAGASTLEADGDGTHMSSGGGATKFVVNNASAVIDAASGNDTVESAVNYTLPDDVNITQLTLTGHANLVAQGNSGNDVLTGNDGNSTLIAGSGNATLIAGAGVTSMQGGWGDDTFVVNNSNDIISTPLNDSGTVLSSVSYVLADGIANLTLTGDADLVGQGNLAKGVITGNAGRDTLIAGFGDETLVAGSGVDTLEGNSYTTYVVNNEADVIIDSGGGKVMSSVNYNVSHLVSSLTLTGSADLTATGNSESNTITANAGNDTLVAGTGDETLIGGSGHDTFVLNAGFGQDEIQSQAGTLKFGAGIALSQLSLQTGVDQGGSPFLTLTDGASSIQVDKAFSNAISEIQFADGGQSYTLNQLIDQLGPIDSVSHGNTGDLHLVAGGGHSIAGGTGNDTLLAYGGHNTVVAGTGNQQLVAIDANDMLVGGAGLDTLTGGAGDDTLVAGTGNSTLIGGQANNVYALTAGGLTQIDSTNTSGTELITLPSGMSLQDFVAFKNGNDLLIQASNGGTTAVVKNYYGAQPSARTWAIASDVGTELPELLDAWVTTKGSTDGSGDQYQAAANSALIEFKAKQAIDLKAVGQAGGTLGSAGEIRNGAYSYAYSYGYSPYGDFVNAGDYQWQGVSSSSIVVNSDYALPSSELSTVDVISTTTSYTALVPTYSTVTDGGNQRFVPIASIPQFFSYPTNSVSVVRGTPTADDPGGPILGLLFDTPSVSRQIQTGMTSVTYDRTSSTLTATRGFTTYDVTVDSGNHVITTQGPFRGVVSLGNGNDYLNLGGYVQSVVEPNTPGVTGSVSAPAWVAVPGDQDVPTYGNAGLLGNVASGAAAFVRAGDGDDTIVGSNGDNVFVAGAGHDYIAGGTGNNTYYVPLSGTATEVINNITSFGVTGDIPTYIQNQLTSPTAVLGYFGASVKPLTDSTLVIPDAINPSDLSYRIVTDSPDYPGEQVLELHYQNSSVVIPYGTMIGQTRGNLYKLFTSSETNYQNMEIGGYGYSIAGIQHFQFSDGRVLTLDELLSQAQPWQASGLIVQAHNCALFESQAVSAATLVSASDTSGQSIDYYEFENSPGNSGYFTVNGVQQDAGATVRVTSSQLATVQYVGGSTQGDDTVTIRVFAGGEQSSVQALMSVQGSTGGTLQSSAPGQTLIGMGGTPSTLVGNHSGDTLVGGSAADIFYVNDPSVVVQQSATGGTSVVYSSVDYTLPANVSSLVLTGSDNLHGTGNAAGCSITANSGNDTLIAGSGIATLIGGTGSDTFVVNNTSDVVQAQAGGVNAIQTSVSYTAAANVTNLTGTGTGDLTLTGNGQPNVITANSGNDTLVAGSGGATLIGGAGHDTLQSGSGQDTLIAGSGTTTFLLQPGSGADVIQDDQSIASGTTGSDVIKFGAGISQADVSIYVQGQDLKVSYGRNDSVVVQAYAGSSQQGGMPIGRLEFADGAYSLLSTNSSGVVTQTDFNTQGLEVGSSTHALDGTVSGELFDLQNGGSSTFTDDGQGNIVRDDYASGGGLVAHRVTTKDMASGAVNTQVFGADGTLIERDWITSGSTGQELYRADGSSELKETDVYADASTFTTDTVTQTDGSYVQNWSQSNGNSGFTTWNQSTGEVTGRSTRPGDGYTESWDNTVLANGASESKYTYAYTDSSTYSTDTVTQADGSYVQNWSQSNGNSGFTTWDQSTGEVTGQSTRVGDGYTESWDNTNLANGASESKATYTFTDLSTYSTDTVTQADGSYTESWSRSDGSYGTQTANHATGEITSSSTSAAYSMNADFTVLANGASETKVLYTYTDASTLTTDRVVQADGSYAESWSRSDGDHGTNYVDAGQNSSSIYAWGTAQGLDIVQEAGSNNLMDISGVAPEQLWFAQDGSNLDISILGTDDHLTIDNWYQSDANKLSGFRVSDGRTLLSTDVDKLVEAMATVPAPVAGQTQYTSQESQVLQPVLAANWH